MVVLSFASFYFERMGLCDWLQTCRWAWLMLLLPVQGCALWLRAQSRRWRTAPPWGGARTPNPPAAKRTAGWTWRCPTPPKNQRTKHLNQVGSSANQEASVWTWIIYQNWQFQTLRRSSRNPPRVRAPTKTLVSLKTTQEERWGRDTPPQRLTWFHHFHGHVKLNLRDADSGTNILQIHTETASKVFTSIKWTHTNVSWRKKPQKEKFMGYIINISLNTALWWTHVEQQGRLTNYL